MLGEKGAQLTVLGTHKSHEAYAVILEKAVELVNSELPDSEAIKILGEGWVGEEALAIAGILFFKT
jgi:hypothetical protein